MKSGLVEAAYNHYSPGLQKEMTVRYSRASCDAATLDCHQGGWWLDIGPSIGLGLSELAGNQLYKVVAIDNQLNYIRTSLRINPTVSVAVMEGGKLGFRDRSFNVISLFEVIEHMDQSSQFNLLREVNRVLKPGGLLFLSTPNREARGKRPISHDHVHELNEEELLDLFKQSRFDLVYLAGQGFKSDNSRIKLWEKARDNAVLFWTYHHLIPNRLRHNLRDQTLEAFEANIIREPGDREIIKSFYAVARKNL